MIHRILVSLRRVAVPLAWLVAGAGLPAADLAIVTNGRPAAVIVTADQPSAAASYAATELADHIAKASGAKLSIVTERAIPAGPATRIFLGATRAARAAGIDVDGLPPETFVLRTAAGAFYIAGRDAAGSPMEQTPPFGTMDQSAGTLFGVYEWLDRELGVRWLWPGELGTFVPKRSSIVVRAVDETIAPRFAQRNVRPGLGFTSEHPALGFTPKAAAAYARDQTIFLRRHRLGRSYPMSYRHAFTDWWEKYGAEHPEWFQLVNGKRGPVNPGDRYSMCVSNVGLQKKIVELWREKGGAEITGRPSIINAVENDFPGACECDHCRAWDGPQPPDRDKYYAPNFKVYGARYMSDRYARFVLAVQQLAAQENPNAAVVGYAYFNYFQAPNTGVQLNPNVIIGFCPSAGWYPRAPDEHEWYKQQWRGWAETGARVFARTNYFLDGHSMPFIFAHHFADDFQFQARHGMFATDFDSLTGQWSTQGTNLYLLMRLHVRPDRNVDDLLAEYFSGFGPAALAVKAYFDYWENYTMSNREHIMDVFYDRVAIRWRSWAKASHRIFPPESFGPAKDLLAQALGAAATDAEAKARVQFLVTGLTHAELCVKVGKLLTQADPESTPERGKAALEELLRFRRAHEMEWFANLAHNAWVEGVSWKLSSETKREPEYYP